jgi:hypothetical protein
MMIRIVRNDLPAAFCWLFTSALAVSSQGRVSPTGFGRILANWWSAVGPLEPAGFPIVVRDAQRPPFRMRVRAATALEPVRW